MDNTKALIGTSPGGTASGWNTWNPYSVTSHVLMPQGFSVNLGIKEYASGDYIRDILPGRQTPGSSPQREDNSPESVQVGARSLDGAYTSIRVSWRGIVLDIESAVRDGELVLMIRAVESQRVPATLIVETGFLWGRPGTITVDTEERIRGESGERIVEVRGLGDKVTETHVPCRASYFALRLQGEVFVYTGKEQTRAQLKAIVAECRHPYQETLRDISDELCRARRDALGWNIIHDPQQDRVLAQVVRLWSSDWGGWVQHGWDMYFLAELLAPENAALAQHVAVEISKEVRRHGFVPNCVAAGGFATLDRSQPPVGGLIVRRLFERFGDQSFLREVFDDLLQWNRWYMQRRHLGGGQCTWGSEPYEPVYGNHWESAGVGEFYGAAMESGLDNAPMYDDLALDDKTHCLKLADVGLTSLLLADTEALSMMAAALGREELLPELDSQCELLAQGIQSLWDESTGMFLNKHTDSGHFSDRVSPTNFYPLLTAAVSSAQAQRMVHEHLLNDDEFWGQWVIPSVSREDPAFAEQDYWRGRIWPPMNFLVYLGLERYGFKNEKHELARKSADLFLREWRSHRHVHENYGAESGDGCDVDNSEACCAWGALLAHIYLLDSESSDVTTAATPAGVAGN